MYEVFKEKILPQLRTLFKEEEKVSDSSLHFHDDEEELTKDDDIFNRFLSILRCNLNQSYGYSVESLKRRILNEVLLDDDELDNDEKFRTLFNLLLSNNGRELRTVEYVNNSTRITIRYNDVKDLD